MKKLLPYRFVYSYYADVTNNPGNEKEILRQLFFQRYFDERANKKA